MYDLSGKVAIVTGAGGKLGFGRAIADRLAREGADVAVVDKVKKPARAEDADPEWQGIESVAKEIQGLGRRSMALLCDIADSTDVDRMVKDVVTRFGKVDILVNNAGVKINSNPLEITDEVWNLHLAVNLTGMFYCSRAVAREMVKSGTGGRIINIGSQWGKQGSANKDMPYVVSKFGVHGLTQCLALELAKHKILVNAVCPALTDTGINREQWRQVSQREGIPEEEAKERMYKRVLSTFPVGRLGLPDDIANAVAFLSSDEATFICGESLNVNGGVFTAI